MKKKDMHKTDEGLNIMLNLKSGMNRGRLLNSDLFNSKDRLKVIKDINYFDEDKKS